MALPNNPITRKEMYLSNIAGQGTTLPDEPITREEEYLDYIAKNGGGGTGDGDMKKSVYDSDLDVSGAGGIKAFVNGQTNDLQPKTLDTPIEIGGESRTTVEAALGALEDNKEDTILAATPLVKEYDEVMRQDVLRLTMDDTPTANSNNPVKSGGIKSALSATVDLLKDTIGWLGKQRLPFPYKDGNSKTMNGITYTVDSEGVIDINGTAVGGNSVFNLSGEYGVPDNRVSALRGNYVLDVTNAVPANSNIAISIRKSDNETLWSITNEQKKIEVDFTEQLHAYGWIYIFVPNGTEVNHYKVKPLLTEKSIYDISPAHELYHESVEDYIWDINAKTGAHNFLNTEKFETGTKNGITSTVRADKGISLTGTSTIQSGTIFFRNYGTVLKAGTYKYKLNKNPKGTCVIGLNDSSTGLGNYKILTNLTTNLTEISFTVTDEDLASKPYVFCELGVSYNAGTIDEVYYPQILLNEDTFGSFMPFAMTNEQLTESLKYRNVQLTPVPNTGTNYEKVVNVAEQLDALITDVGVKFSGYVLWTQSMFLRVEAMRCNATTLLYTIFNVSNTIYNGAVQNGAVTVYKFEGTQMTS